jgi:predicted nucleic acid-binding protein
VLRYTQPYNIIIPKEVEEEAIVKGIHAKYPDAFRLQNHVKRKNICVQRVKNSLKVKQIINQFNIGKGEAEAIALWYEVKNATLGLDDHKGVVACKSYGIPFITALTFVIIAKRHCIIEANKAHDMIKRLDIYGRYKADLIYEAVRIIGDTNDKA